MSAKNKKTAPLVISDEHNEIKIYTVKGRAGCNYQLSYYRAGERQRKTFADVNEAKRQARVQLGLLAGERIQARALTTVEMESYMAPRSGWKPRASRCMSARSFSPRPTGFSAASASSMRRSIT